jgi:hypothetical protein
MTANQRLEIGAPRVAQLSLRVEAVEKVPGATE